MTEALTTKQLSIAGRVQGVGYRAGFAREAQRLKLSGWVRNRRDGSVEALVQGSTGAIDAIIAWSRRGPGLAHVDHVSITEIPDDTSHAGEFKVLPTE